MRFQNENHKLWRCYVMPYPQNPQNAHAIKIVLASVLIVASLSYVSELVLILWYGKYNYLDYLQLTIPI